MKLNEKNSKFAIVRTAFHGGGVVAFTNSLKQAMRIKSKHTAEDCECGCCGIVPITKSAYWEMLEAENRFGEPIFDSDDIFMYDELPTFNTNMSYYKLAI